jgi:hypothetical protein
MLLPARIGSRAKPGRIKCAHNLKEIGLAFRVFANDNDDRFPFEMPDLVNREIDRRAWTQFLVMSNELGSAKALWCPGDLVGRSAATNFGAGPTASPGTLVRMQDSAVSYFVGTGARTSLHDAILSGDCNLSASIGAPLYSSRGVNPFVIVSTNAMWSTNRSHHDTAGNYALADGSVQQTTTSGLQSQLRQAAHNYGINANRFVFPQ